MKDFIESHGYAVLSYKETEESLKDWIADMINQGDCCQQETLDHFENLEG